MKGLSTLEEQLLLGQMTRIEEAQELYEAKGLQTFNALLIDNGLEMPMMFVPAANAVMLSFTEMIKSPLLLDTAARSHLS